MSAVQLDLLAELTPTPAPARWTPAPGGPPGVRSMTAEEARENLAEGLRWAVPIHIAELRNWPAARRRSYLPPGGLESLGMADAIMFQTKSWKGTARAFDAYARALAILAYEPGGVTLFDLHFCTAPHPGCPRDWTPRRPVDGAAMWAEFHALLDEYEALLDADDAAERGEPVPAPRRERTVPRTRRPARAPRMVDVPAGGVL